MSQTPVIHYEQKDYLKYITFVQQLIRIKKTLLKYDYAISITRSMPTNLTNDLYSRMKKDRGTNAFCIWVIATWVSEEYLYRQLELADGFPTPKNLLENIKTNVNNYFNEIQKYVHSVKATDEEHKFNSRKNLFEYFEDFVLNQPEFQLDQISYLDSRLCVYAKISSNVENYISPENIRERDKHLLVYEKVALDFELICQALYTPPPEYSIQNKGKK